MILKRRISVRALIQGVWFAVALSLAMATSALAATTAPSSGLAAGFEIDGESSTLFSGDGLAGGAGDIGDDWAQGAAGTGALNNDGSPNLPFTTLFVDQNWGPGSPTGDDATHFGGLSNKNTDLIVITEHPWDWGPTGGDVSRVDLTNVYFHTRLDPETGDLWIILAAEMRSDGAETHIDFEINQAGIQQTGLTIGQLIGLGPDGGRTHGDLIITVDIDDQIQIPVPAVRSWDGATNTWVVQDDPFDDLILVSVNTGEQGITHSAAASPWHHYELDGGISPTGAILQNQFIEGAVRAGTFFDIFNGDTTVIVKTRASPSFTAELRDFALFFFRPFERPPVIAEIASAPAATPPDFYFGPTPDLLAGARPTTWSLASAPVGVTIDPLDGAISWPSPPVEGGMFDITVRATNLVDPFVDEETFQLEVVPPSTLPVPPVVMRSIDIAPAPPDSTPGPASMEVVVLTPGAGSAYTLARAEFPGFVITDADDPDRTEVTFRRVMSNERSERFDGQGFPTSSSAVYAFVTRTAASSPIQFTAPVNLTLQFMDGTEEPFVSADTWTFSGARGPSAKMRICEDRLVGLGANFEFIDYPQTVDLENQTVRVEGITTLTDEEGVGIWGLAVDPDVPDPPELVGHVLR